MADFALQTERLILRGWRDDDAAPFHAMCSDPRVMEFLGDPLSMADVHAAIARQRHFQARLGHCFWAIERREDGDMLGFCGLKPGPAGTPIEGRTEIGWRLAHHAWGQGFAQEAARASLDWGFAHLAGEAIWAITVPANQRSRSLMVRLGMERRTDLDFDHPSLDPASPLLRHVTYEKRQGLEARG